MKQIILVLSTLFLLFALSFSAAAYNHPGAPGPEEVTVSPWASEEVQRALSLDMIPYWISGDYRVPVTRGQYVDLVLEYVALQQHCDSSSLKGLVKYYLAELNADGYSIKDVFTDGDYNSNVAFYLGLVKGRGKGLFDPEGLLTRQEAAAILARAYICCGGTLPGNTGVYFSDEERIAQWATESVSALTAWNIMEKMDYGSFCPDGYISIEECIVTLLRLYDNAPISRINGNVKRLFTYEQCIEYIPNMSDCFYENFKLEGSIATFIRMDLGGMMRPASSLFLVYHDGGIKRLATTIWDSSWGFSPSQRIENISFSKDGRTLYYTITLQKDTISYEYEEHPEGIIINKKGLYHATVDVDTGSNQVRREAVPEGVELPLTSSILP